MLHKPVVPDSNSFAITVCAVRFLSHASGGKRSQGRRSPCIDTTPSWHLAKWSKVPWAVNHDDRWRWVTSFMLLPVDLRPRWKSDRYPYFRKPSRSSLVCRQSLYGLEYRGTTFTGTSFKFFVFVIIRNFRAYLDYAGRIIWIILWICQLRFVH
jgi:hypothetical protein